jgi:hypothetical protein
MHLLILSVLNTDKSSGAFISLMVVNQSRKNIQFQTVHNFYLHILPAIFDLNLSSHSLAMMLEGFGFFDLCLFLCFADCIRIDCCFASNLLASSRFSTRIKKRYLWYDQSKLLLFYLSKRYLNRHNLPPEGVIRDNKPATTNNENGFFFWFCFLYFHVRQWNNTLWHRGTSIFFGTR